jgi:DnaJ-class molecular chaperone
MARNYYRVLGLPDDASDAEIRDAYHRLARLHHPDISGSESSAAFRDIQEAWETLGDPELRRVHDEQLWRAGRQGPGPSALRSEEDVLGNSGPEADPFLEGTLDWVSDRPVLHFGLEMSPQEARSGGQLPLRVPIRFPCPACDGAGHQALFGCPACRGEGCRVNWTTLPVAIPSGLRDDDTLELPLDPFGWPSGLLLLHVAIQAA